MARTETRPLALVTSEPVRVDLSRGEGVDELHQHVVLVGGPVDAAAQSFVQSFAPALRAGMTDTKLGSSAKDDPADVARDGFEALMAGKERVVSASLKTKVQGRAGRLVPDSMKARMHGEQARRGSGDD